MSKWRDEGMATHERSDLPRPRRKKTCLRCAEAATFLDGLADHMGGWDGNLIDEAAADCRAMAGKLRGTA
jgi:hypothetical protein